MSVLGEAPTVSELGEEVKGSRTYAPKHPRNFSIRENPFAEREGKSLIWTNVNMIVAPKSSKDKPKHILSGVWGEIPPKQITAIAGPSGSGKTSLLNILSGRIKSRGLLTVNADVRLNNCEVKPTKMSVRKQIAFVAQDDSLQVASTPRECIRFSAKLRLPRSTSEKELDHLTDRMIEELGLTKCADTMLGGPLLKGISGGERKRTSVGMELVVKPSLVFLDEPTSGLDSFSAIQLVNVLKKVSNAGASVLFTIHQPSSAVFGSFDQFLLLNRGKVMYQGAAGDLTVYLSEHRYAIPPHHNPADFVMNLAQTLSDAELEEAGLYLKDTRNLPLAERLRAVEVINVCTQRASKHSEVDERRVSMLTEINLLFIREVRNLVRFRQPLVARFGFSSFMSLLVGVIFFDVGTLSSDVPKVNLYRYA